jgi:hypothetical protein
MSYMIHDFTQQVTLVYMRNKWNPNRLTIATNLATALNPDPTTRSAEVQTAAVGLRPGNAANNQMLNDLLLIVNRGKGGNLTPLAMSNAITAALSTINPPVNTAAPVVTATSLSVAAAGVCSTTVGTWNYVPTSYRYQWYRGGILIAGATTNSHALVVADEGFNISCRVLAENAAGETTMASNAVGPVVA